MLKRQYHSCFINQVGFILDCYILRMLSHLIYISISPHFKRYIVSLLVTFISLLLNVDQTLFFNTCFVIISSISLEMKLLFIIELHVRRVRALNLSIAPLNSQILFHE